MSSAQVLLSGFPSQLLIAVDSADFDGTNDYMTRGAGLTSVSDSKSGLLSFWFRPEGGNTVQNLIHAATTLGGATGRFRVRVNSSVWNFEGLNAAGTTILHLRSSTAAGSISTAWHHFLASWNLAVPGARHLYLDDVSDLSGSFTFTDDTIDYTVADWAIGGQANGDSKFDGQLAEVYFQPGAYLDLSVASNRRRFRSAAGKPIFIGANGNRPLLNTIPAIYQHLDNGEAAANFATNRGGGGNFTVTGTLTTGGTSPSD